MYLKLLKISAFMEIENPDRFDVTPIINECNELFAYFATKCVESLIKCTRTSLDILRRRASVSRFLTFLSCLYTLHLLFNCGLVLRVCRLAKTFKDNIHLAILAQEFSLTNRRKEYSELKFAYRCSPTCFYFLALLASRSLSAVGQLPKV